MLNNLYWKPIFTKRHHCFIVPNKLCNVVLSNPFCFKGSCRLLNTTKKSILIEVLNIDRGSNGDYSILQIHAFHKPIWDELYCIWVKFLYRHWKPLPTPSTLDTSVAADNAIDWKDNSSGKELTGSEGLHNEEDYVSDPPLTWNNNVMNNTSLGLLSKAELGRQPTGSWSNDMS